jgi:hypothetical protein
MTVEVTYSFNKAQHQSEKTAASSGRNTSRRKFLRRCRHASIHPMPPNSFGGLEMAMAQRLSEIEHCAMTFQANCILNG